MTTLTVPERYTPEDLLSMPDGDHFELVDGQLVETDMGAEASWIAGELYALLRAFNLEARLGWVLPGDIGYLCFPEEPARVRKPDASFIRFGRLRGEQIPKGHIPIAPDLAVEVVSPNDLYYEVQRKVGEYRRAGVREVWVVNPETRTVEVFRADGSVAWLHEEDELSSEAVLPGFRCGVAELFARPAGAPEPEAGGE